MSSAMMVEMNAIVNSEETLQTTFIFPNFPIELQEDKLYIVSAWDTNCYLTGKGGYDYEIFEHYGAKLKEGKEYLLIYPKY